MIEISGIVLCAGNLTQDILVWPVDEVVFHTTTWVNDIVTSIGGNGANTSYAIGRLGGAVRLLGMVGRDETGDHVLAQLRDVGVDVRVERCDVPTSSTVVVVRTDGARSFLHRPGASREAFGAPIEFTRELIAGCTHFHLANPFAMPKMRGQSADTLARARSAGLTTSLDTGWDALGEWMNVIGPCLPQLDLLFVNEDEAEQLSGSRDPQTAAAFFRERGVGSTVVKLGSRGCGVFDGCDQLCIPAFAVKTVDTTGAGDCFAGAFLAGLQKSMRAAEVARFANAVGALSVGHAGATTGLLNCEDTLRWMRV